MRCNEKAEGFEKMSQTSSDVEPCVEALTLHPRGLVPLLRNFRSLKYLTTAQDNANLASRMQY